MLLNNERFVSIADFICYAQKKEAGLSFFAQVAGATVIWANGLSFPLLPPQMVNQQLISPAIARSFV